ncbi:hypothetical protein [Bacterioplanoides sp.]|uniref:hypothetical protein n=1 Tax=Bacterioplanoides sp. TaxID=2066072 RepID=UPI003B5C1215
MRTNFVTIVALQRGNFSKSGYDASKKADFLALLLCEEISNQENNSENGWITVQELKVSGTDIVPEN